MKRISIAAIAAATALSLSVTPAFAAEESATGDTTVTENAGNQGTSEQPEGEKDKKEEDKKPEGEQDKKDDKNGNKGEDKQGSSNQAAAIGGVTGTLAAILTTGLIVFSNPTGLNKMIDILNAQFGLGLAHVHVPKVF